MRKRARVSPIFHCKEDAMAFLDSDAMQYQFPLQGCTKLSYVEFPIVVLYNDEWFYFLQQKDMPDMDLNNRRVVAGITMTALGADDVTFDGKLKPSLKKFFAI